MDELLEEIQDIQKYLYGGFKNDGETNLDWLELLSSKFLKLFKILHKFLIFEVTNPANRGAIIEQAFLCANQIIVCLKFLEKTVQKEVATCCLITSRQCFFERILWCLARLKSTVKSANDHVLTGFNEPENFVALLDHTIDILSLFIGLDNNTTNKAELKAELMMESREIRGTIELLLGHAMAFSNIALESDKNPITVLSQNVMKIAMEFEEEFSLSQPGKKADESAQRLKAIELENSMLSLERFVNNALLRLVFEVFHVMDKNVIAELASIEDPTELDEAIERFDLLVDRLIQIGHFAIWFSRDDPKVSSIIRSTLASIESLDSYLIPAITSKSDPSIDVFQEHFQDETKLLQRHVQQIIDTKAFCGILTELINDAIELNRAKFDKALLLNLVQRANVLMSHFQINSKSLQLTSDKVTKFYFNDFKLILTECEAILNFPEEIEDGDRRILKRFKIMNSTLAKLQNALKNLQKSSIDDDFKNDIVKISELPSKCSDYFNTIRPSALGSILFESKRSIKFKPSTTSKSAISTIRRSTKKRRSLRIAIFRKRHDDEVEEAFNADEPHDDLSMNLQITEILEKLTDLSTTLTHSSD